MDWQQRLAGLAAPFDQLGPVQWLAIATSLGFVVVLGVLIANSRSRREISLGGADPRRQPVSQHDGQSPLDGISLSPIDRVFPRKPTRKPRLIFDVSKRSKPSKMRDVARPTPPETRFPAPGAISSLGA